MKLLESTTSKVVSGVVALGVVVGGITWWQTPVETRSAILSAIGRIAGWAGLVAVVPFALCLGVAWVAKKYDSNGAAAAMILSITAIESLLLAWLLHWSISGAASWIFFLLATALAGAYNLLVCDWLVEKV